MHLWRINLKLIGYIFYNLYPTNKASNGSMWLLFLRNWFYLNRIKKRKNNVKYAPILGNVIKAFHFRMGSVIWSGISVSIEYHCLLTKGFNSHWTSVKIADNILWLPFPWMLTYIPQPQYLTIYYTRTSIYGADCVSFRFRFEEFCAAPRMCKCRQISNETLSVPRIETLPYFFRS